MTPKVPSHSGERRPKEPYGDLAAGLWQRLKEMLLVRKRLESYVFKPEGDPKEELDRWLDRLIEDEGEIRLIATEMTLRAFRLGVEAINYKILTHVKNERAISISSLAQLTGLPELLVGERVSDLAQVGLAFRSLENDQVEATLLTASFLEIIEDAADELARNIRERLPSIKDK